VGDRGVGAVTLLLFWTWLAQLINWNRSADPGLPKKVAVERTYHGGVKVVHDTIMRLISD
jgi:hypothetical protein